MADSKAEARKAARIEKRRAQILEAARRCFRAEGFHGASMSRIAEAAHMSVGHIYQYYASKEAIIMALSEIDFRKFVARMPDPGSPDLAGAPLGAPHVTIDDISWLLDPDRSALALEVMSEASRNPTIREMVRRAGDTVRTRVRRRMEERLPDLSAADLDVRVEALMLITSGLGIRAAIEPDVDPDRMRRAVAVAVAALAGGTSEEGENHGK